MNYLKGTILILLCFPLIIFSQYQIGKITSSIQDPNRPNRNITFEICYPATVAGNNTMISAGLFPTIVFGHGFGIAVSEYDIWCETLATKGYIYVLPTTEGGVFPFPKHEEFSLDMSFLIDHFNSSTSPFYLRILMSAKELSFWPTLGIANR